MFRVVLGGTNDSAPSAAKSLSETCRPTTPLKPPMGACWTSRRPSRPLLVKVVEMTPASISSCA